MWTNTNNIVNNNQSRFGLNNNNLPKYKSIVESRLLKPETRTLQSMTNQVQIKRFQKSYYNNENLSSNQKILNQNQIYNNNNNQHRAKNYPIRILKDFNYNNNLQYHENDMTTKNNNCQKYNKQNNDGGKIDLNRNNQDKNARKYYYYQINNRK